jgi:serine/threonine protein phosphatase PrpC
MTYICYSLKTDIGRQREKNEDSLFVDDTNGIFIIADGLGGHPYGEVASQMAVSLVPEVLRKEIDGLLSSSSSSSFFAKDEVIYGIIDYTLRLADKKITEEGKRTKDLYGMGTTIVLFFVANLHTIDYGGIDYSKFYLANIGDSRAYLISKEEESGEEVQQNQVRKEKEKLDIKQLTQDHSIVDVMKIDIFLTDHPFMKHAVTQYLGMHQDILSPVIQDFHWKKDDYILLCSDGLTNMLNDREIAMTISECQNEIMEEEKHQQCLQKEMEKREKILQRSCEMLVGKANRKGGEDNITVILVQKTK